MGDKILEWYTRPEVAAAIAREAENKEIGVKFSWGFGKRPDILTSAADVMELAKQGATSFHFSEENWDNPLSIVTGMTARELALLRIGWDLIIDIDTPHFPYSQIAAHYVIAFLKYYGVKTISCKFSGNHGFHIAVPFEAFPKNVLQKEVHTLFPQAPQKIAKFIKSGIEKKVVEDIMKQGKEVVEERVGKKLSTNPDMDDIVGIDTILISSRHLCRMPYVFNEKSGLLSIPCDDVLSFKREDATPEKVKEFPPYLQREKAIPGEATKLFVEAFDATMEEYQAEQRKEHVPKVQREHSSLEHAAPESYFPPCITKLLGPLEDGKKRALFVLIHFLASVGWDWPLIEDRLAQWNKQHPEPLREVYLKGQIRYAKSQEPKLPPNCNTEGYYSALQVKCEPNICSKCFNPVNYTKRRVLFLDEKDKKAKKTAPKKAKPKQETPSEAPKTPPGDV